MEKSVRNPLLDVVKGLLIILVLLGHAIQYGSGAAFLSGGEFYNNLIFRFIYSFHMPLFMGVAGYLSYFSLQKHGARNYIIRRWSRLFPPILIWSTGLIGLHCYIMAEGAVFCGNPVVILNYFLVFMVVAFFGNGGCLCETFA